ncbi:MAG: acyl-CoA thioesterase [Armatimonadetes bacterium]|nr:acyl-CoA thioesterase [Armatimonadota bacterium]MDE2208074.1 acyl-CoA thioesterase [Armatimonadota bacterium]
MSAFPSHVFVSTQRVYFDMLDLLETLHNARFLLLFERARTDFWREVGGGRAAHDFDWPYLVARNEIDYRVPITTEQDVQVTVTIERIGRSSLTFAHSVILADERVSASGKTVIVRVDASHFHPVPWSEGFRNMLAAWVQPKGG